MLRASAGTSPISCQIDQMAASVAPPRLIRRSPGRTHGLALRFRDEKRRLPVLDACPKNYADVDLGTLDPSTVLDQTTLSTLVATLDAVHADALKRSRGARFEVHDVLGHS